MTTMPLDLTRVWTSTRLPLAGFAKAREAHVCVRCSLRLGGVEDLAVYTCPTTELLKELSRHVGTPEESVEKDVEVCACCLGILSDAFQQQLIASARAQMEERAYDAKSFALAIKLPSAVLVREFAMRHHLRENVERYAGKAAFDLKEAFKGMILAPLSAALNDAECTKTSDLSVTIDLKHDGAADEAQQLPAIKQQVEQTKKRRRGPPVVMDGFGAVTRALASLTTLPESVQCPPAVLDTIVTGDVVFEREPVYVQGRYLKYKRGLSQTPWVLEGTRMGSSSVEECIGDVALPFFKGRSYKFHTAGREDVDVRMLGNGRPFILEIIDATRANIADDEWQQIEDAVNKANEGVVAIRQVKMSTKEYFAGLQAGADSKKKTYCCVVWTAGELTPEAVAKLDSIHDLTIQQQTPIRVLHRRTLMTRPKIIHAAKCEVLNKHYMLLRLTTSAGTYVKEFVHGDRGRTVPNVSSILGCGADILQLDVESLIDAE